VIESRTVSQRLTVPRRVAFLRGRKGMAVAVAGLANFGAILILVRRRRSDELDLALTLRWQARRHRSFGRLMKAASWPGFPPQSRLIPPILVIGLLALGLRVEAFFQLLAWGSAGLSEAVKSVVRRPRPLPEQVQIVIAPLGGTSFPSGHVLTYVGNYGFLAFLVYTLVDPPAVRWPLTAGLVGLIGLVGPSRIHQGHHWPTDVAASYLLGLAYVVGLTALYRRVRWPHG
jgi:membrane-associated phospholipid phosphatase